MAYMAGTARTRNNSIDNIGKKFNRLTVVDIEYTGRPDRGYNWVCRCDCGKIIKAAPAKIRGGHTKSCGCSKIERIRTDPKMSRTTHGGKNTRLYRIWRGMAGRCYNERSKDYARYGGRGIAICDEWRHDFSAFREWAYANGYSDYLSIDRIDVNGNYEPDNCRWATPSEQGNNKRNSHLIEHDGVTHTVTEWANIYGIEPKTLFNRIRIGWSFEYAVTAPKNAPRG